MFFGELACLGVWIDLYIAEGIWILERSSSFDEETNRVWFWIWSYQDFFLFFSITHTLKSTLSVDLSIT